MTTFQEITAENTNPLPPTGIPQWDQEGVLHLERIIPESLIDAYVQERRHLLEGTQNWLPGWNGPCPYLHVYSMRNLALYRPLTEAMKPLIGGNEPGLHLCLSGFRSTERALHMDSYLNPAGVEDHYIAAWIVLEDVHPDAGPFEYVPGSHRWPVIRREKVWDAMKVMNQRFDADSWPSDTQGWVGQACEQEIARRGESLKQFIGKRGDVLLWHSQLVHRGSIPRNDKLERRSLISHFSSIKHRPDMPAPTQAPNGSYYFVFPDYKEPGISTHKSKPSSP